MFVQCEMGRRDTDFPIMALRQRADCKEEILIRSGDYKLVAELIWSGAAQVKELVSQTVLFEQTEDGYKKGKEGYLSRSSS